MLLQKKNARTGELNLNYYNKQKLPVVFKIENSPGVIRIKNSLVVKSK